MLLPFLIVAISLTVAICKPTTRDVAKDHGNKRHLQRHFRSIADYDAFQDATCFKGCDVQGFQRLGGRIFVLCASDSIRVYKDKSPFDLVKNITLKELGGPSDFTSSAASNCLYAFTDRENCILKISLEDYTVTKWLCEGLERFTKMSVSADGQVVVVIDHRYVKLYGPDAKLKREFTIQLVDDSRKNSTAELAILEENGDFLTVQKAYNVTHIFWVLCQTKPNGDLRESDISITYSTAAYYNDKKSCWSVEKRPHSPDAKISCVEPTFNFRVLLYFKEDTLKLNSSTKECKHFINIDGTSLVYKKCDSNCKID